jgi:outer membrane immunogenic protein
MQRFAVIAAAAFVAAPAFAAELGVLKPLPGPEPYYSYYKVPPSLTVGWTGCYLGGHVGGAFSNYDFTDGPFPFLIVPPSQPTYGNTTLVTVTLPATTIAAGSGVIGGQAGCNLELGSKWLIGVEADAAWTRITGHKSGTTSGTIIGAGNAGTIVNEAGTLALRTDFIATATARLGYELGYYNQGLVYGKGGIAWTINKFDFAGTLTAMSCNDISNPTAPTGCVQSTTNLFDFGSGRQNWFGWTIGAGIEWALVGGWSVKGEYNYMNFGRHAQTLTDPVFGPSILNIKQEISEVKLGLNYLFGRPPVNLPTMW